MSKTFLVTGATDGIGKETARALVAMGHSVTLVARSEAKAKAVMAEIGGKTRFVACDLFSSAAIDRAADDILASHPRIDGLVNNAGGLFAKREETAEGVEKTWSLNHLAYARLTSRLVARLRESAPARVVCVASRMHMMGKLDFGDLEFGKRHYNAMQAYADSKLANVMYAAGMARRLTGSGVTINSLHPGFVASQFGRGNGGVVGLLARFTPLMGAITPVKGALTSIHLATSPAVEGVSGGYFADGRQAEPAAGALDVAAQDRLMADTETRLGFSLA